MARNVEVYVRGHDEASGVLRGVGGALGFLGGAAQTALGFLGGQLVGNAISGLQSLAGEAVQATAVYEQMALSLHSLAAKEALATGEALNMEHALAMTGNKAQELLGWVQELAIKSPFSSEGVAQAFRTALAYGFTTEQAQRLTQATIDFASATGASSAAMNTIALALGQIQAKGKLAAQEILQLTNVGVPALQILADHFGVTTAEASKMIEKGLIPAEEAIEAITQSLESDFGGAAERASNSWAGLLGTFEDLKQMGLRALFEGIGESVQPLVANFAAWLQDEGMTKIKELGQDLGNLAQAGVALFQVFDGLVNGTDMWIVGLGKLAEIFPAVKEHLPELYNLLKQVTEGFETGGLIGGIEGLGQALLEMLPPDVQSAISDFVLQFEDLAAALENRGPLIEEVLGNIGETLSNVFAGIAPQLGENVTNALTALTNIINSDFVTSLITSFGMVMQVLVGLGGGLLTILSGLITAGLQALSGDFGGAWETIKASVGEGIEAVKSAFTGKWEDFAATWKGNFDNLSLITGEVFSKIKNSITDKVSEISTTLGTALSDMIEGAMQAAGDAAGIGSALIDGIIGGVAGGAGALAEALIAAVEGAIAAAMAAAGIASPSEVTQNEIGQPMAEGIVQGIINQLQAQAGQVAQGVDQLIGSVANQLAASGIMEGGSLLQSSGFGAAGQPFNGGAATGFSGGAFPNGGGGGTTVINQNLQTTTLDNFAVGQLFNALQAHAQQAGYSNPVLAGSAT